MSRYSEGDPIPIEKVPRSDSLMSSGGVQWARVLKWCREHPGEAREFVAVYSNAPTYLRKRFKEEIANGLEVISVNFREAGPEDPYSSRVCDMYICWRDPSGHAPRSD